jgi:hypothetical protein
MATDALSRRQHRFESGRGRQRNQCVKPIESETSHKFLTKATLAGPGNPADRPTWTRCSARVIGFRIGSGAISRIPGIQTRAWQHCRHRIRSAEPRQSAGEARDALEQPLPRRHPERKTTPPVALHSRSDSAPGRPGGDACFRFRPPRRAGQSSHRRLPAAAPRASACRCRGRWGERLDAGPPQSIRRSMETSVQNRRKTPLGKAKFGNHGFRATGITAYPKNGGTLGKAAATANHGSTRTT